MISEDSVQTEQADLSLRCSRKSYCRFCRSLSITHIHQYIALRQHNDSVCEQQKFCLNYMNAQTGLFLR